MFKFIDSNYLKYCLVASAVLPLAGCSGTEQGTASSDARQNPYRSILTRNLVTSGH